MDKVLLAESRRAVPSSNEGLTIPPTGVYIILVHTKSSLLEGEDGGT